MNSIIPIIRVVLSAVLVLLPGCGTREKGIGVESRIDTVFVHDTVKSVKGNRSKKIEELVSAVVTINNLDKDLFKLVDVLTERQSVIDFFEKGFTHDIAVKLTDWHWSDESGSLVAGERVLSTPDTVCILSLFGDSAVVYYPFYPIMGSDSVAFNIDSLVKKNNVWKIHGGTSVEKVCIRPGDFRRL